MLQLLDRYRHKIKSPEELRRIIGPRPRDNGPLHAFDFKAGS